jgi:dUTP pyrophosphatase
MQKTVKLITGDSYDIPEYKSDEAAGVDLVANVSRPVHIRVGHREIISTGLYMEIPKGMHGEVRSRSGLVFKHGICVANAPGTIDSDYRGEVCVILENRGNSTFVVKRGDRIAQVVFMPYIRVKFKEVTKLKATVRGSGGFGSTGK